MAESPSHKFGQVIGILLETTLRPYLEEFCHSQGLYLDYQAKNRPARAGRKVSWNDSYGNSHDLDFVIERDGADAVIGQPVAFIEVAWRRYTKHSRNKAQEIQGAILPLGEKYSWNNPFLGVVLAGEFTHGSLEQLRSQGFHVLHFPYTTLVSAFAAQGLDIHFDESTPDEIFSRSANQIEQLSSVALQRVSEQIIALNQPEFQGFFEALRARLGRFLRRVVVVPLYGRESEFFSLETALNFLEQHKIYEGSGQFRKYELWVEFSNGDRVEASLASKQKVAEFLQFVIRQ